MLELFPIGADLDLAGGVVHAVSQQWGSVNERLMLVVPDPVDAHVHDPNAMATGSAWMFINNLPVCRMGDFALCGDVLVSTELWFQIA